MRWLGRRLALEAAAPLPSLPFLALRLLGYFGDDFYFDEGSLRQAGDAYGRAGGAGFAERVGVHFVEGREVVDVREEARGLHHVVEVGAGRREQRRHVPHNLLGLLLHGGAHELARRGVERDLARREQQPARDASLHVGADGGRRVSGGDNVHEFLFLSMLDGVAHACGGRAALGSAASTARARRVRQRSGRGVFDSVATPARTATSIRTARNVSHETFVPEARYAAGSDAHAEQGAARDSRPVTRSGPVAPPAFFTFAIIAVLHMPQVSIWEIS